MEYTIDAQFAVEATIPGPEPYSSIKNRASLAIGTVANADSEEEARDMALALLSNVTEDVKLHLAANAPGAEFYVDDNGVSQVGITPKATKEIMATVGKDAAPAPSKAPARAADGGFTPLSHGGDRYTVQWNGVARTLFDNRTSKTGNQPDLKLPKLDGEEKDLAFWIDTQSGGKNKAALALIHQIDEAIPA